MVIGGVFIFLVSCATGLAVGGYMGFSYGASFIINGALSRDAREVEARIATLRDLRAGEKDKAIERLETGLSDILIVFDPEKPYAGLDRQTVVSLRKSIDEARKYRAENPRPQNDFRAKMVDNLFTRELYK